MARHGSIGETTADPCGAKWVAECNVYMKYEPKNASLPLGASGGSSAAEGSAAAAGEERMVGSVLMEVSGCERERLRGIWCMCRRGAIPIRLWGRGGVSGRSRKRGR